MGAPLHCHTCARGGEILENLGKVMEPKRHSCGVMVEDLNHPLLHAAFKFAYMKYFSSFICHGWGSPLHCRTCLDQGHFLCICYLGSGGAQMTLWCHV